MVTDIYILGIGSERLGEIVEYSYNKLDKLSARTWGLDLGSIRRAIPEYWGQQRAEPEPRNW